MGFGVGGVFGESISNIANSTMMPNLTDPVRPTTTDEPSDDIPGTVNLKEEKPEQSGNVDEHADFEKRVKKLMVAKEAGLISEEEFAERKAALLSEI